MPLPVAASTVAPRFPTAAGDSGNGTWAEVAQAKELLQKFGSSGLQIGQGQGHVSYLLSEYTYILRHWVILACLAFSPFLCRAPVEGAVAHVEISKEEDAEAGPGTAGSRRSQICCP